VHPPLYLKKVDLAFSSIVRKLVESSVDVLLQDSDVCIKFVDAAVQLPKLQP